MEMNNKLREALVGLAQAVREFMATKSANFYPDVAIALEVANAALAAPPRNCDRFANEAEARKAFIVWYNTVFGLNGDKWREVSSCDLKRNINDILHDYIEWLYAHATEQEGEPDGSK